MTAKKTKPAKKVAGGADGIAKKKSKPKTVKIRFLKDLKLAETSFKKGDIESFDKKGAEHLIERKIAVRVGRHPREIEAEQKKELEEAKDYERLRNKFAKAELEERLRTEIYGSKLTPEENKLCMAILKDRNLLDIINKEFDKIIVGENNSRKAIFLTACGKYVKNANITSYNLCVNSSSGAGKDYVCKHVLKIFPKTDVQTRSRISKTTLTYWHNSRLEPEWTWEGKILVLLDISSSILNCEVFKLFCSDESHSTVVIDQKAVDILINGKPVMIITTAGADPNNETLRRIPFLQLDETINQTKAIKKAQAKAASDGITLEYNPLITKSLEKLKQVKVKVPFAEMLVDFFPDDHLIMRTHFARLLDYIKASTALYQFQRKVDENGYVIAETQDYDNAAILLKKTTSNPLMIPLSAKQQKLLEVCESLETFEVKKLEALVPFYHHSKIYPALSKLQEYGFLKGSYEDKVGDGKKFIRYYTFVGFKLKNIPTWETIENECRKKGLEGLEGLEGLKGLGGLDDVHMEKKEKTTISCDSVAQSPQSPQSPAFSPIEQDFFIENEEGLKCKVRDILQSKPKYEWEINELAMRCDLAGLKAKKRLKHILKEDILQNREKSPFRMVDEKGFYWSYKGGK